MREIKFEAIYQPTGEHFVPHEIDFKNGTLTGDWDNEIKAWCNFSLDGKTGDAILRQYTGLKDKNGIEIYEGDVIEQPRERNGKYEKVQLEVYWDNGLSYRSDKSLESNPNAKENPSLFNETPKFTTRKIKKKAFPNYSWSPFHNCEVIGNIYEHPHLLEGRDEA